MNKSEIKITQLEKDRAKLLKENMLLKNQFYSHYQIVPQHFEYVEEESCGESEIWEDKSTGKRYVIGIEIIRDFRHLKDCQI